MSEEQEGVEWECSECGYIYVDWEPPESCPQCGAKRHAFVPAAS